MGKNHEVNPKRYLTSFKVRVKLRGYLALIEKEANMLMNVNDVNAKQMKAYPIDAWYDHKRCGWWFTGLGFRFMAYAVSDGNYECDDVKREGDDFVLHLRVMAQDKDITRDVFMTAVLRELRKYWDIDDCLVITAPTSDRS